MGGIEVQLLDEDGGVLATTKTGRDGRYRFDRFGGTGDYSVQIVLPTNAKLTKSWVYLAYCENTLNAS